MGNSNAAWIRGSIDNDVDVSTLIAEVVSIDGDEPTFVRCRRDIRDARAVIAVIESSLEDVARKHRQLEWNTRVDSTIIVSISWLFLLLLLSPIWKKVRETTNT